MTGVRVPEDCGTPPAGWTWRPIRSIARLESGHTPSRRVAEWWGGDIPWLALPDIRALDGKVALATTETTNSLGLANSSARLLPKHTVCLSRTASVGFVTVLGTPMATSQDFVNWVCGPELDPWFLANALIVSRKYFQQLASGAIHKTIYMPAAKSFMVCVPKNILEQHRIVDALSKRRIAVANAAAAAKGQEEQIELLHHNLGQMLIKGGEPVPLGDITYIAAKLVDPQDPRYRNLPHVNGENIEVGTGTLGPSRTAAEDKVISQKFKFSRGDVLYSKLRPYLRKVAIAPYDGLCSADMYPLKVRPDRLLPEFLLMELLSERFSRYAIDESARSRMPKLNREALFAWRVRLPPLDEQRHVVHAANKASREIARARLNAFTQKNELEALDSAFLRTAFAGSL